MSMFKNYKNQNQKQLLLLNYSYSINQQYYSRHL